MKPYLTIRDRRVGYDYDPVVIAEIGINHNGSLDVAFAMVDAAVKAGAEIIKHQTHIIDDEMTKHAKNVIPGNAGISIHKIMSQCALNEDEEFALKEYVEKQGVIFMSTPFSRAAAERLKRFDVDVIKIGSGECNNYPLIEHIASFGKPIILSTGMNSLDTIEPSVAILEKYKISYALLHCTNVYPTPPHLVRLGGMLELEKRFPKAVVGLSDHTTGNLACLGAAALGASILERHFTDSMDRPGPDIICSMDPRALSELVCGAKLLKEMRGGSKEAIPEEKVTMDFAFSSVCTIKSIKKGDKLSKDNIWLKRPGGGDFGSCDYEYLIGKTVDKDIEHDEQLRKVDVIGL